MRPILFIMWLALLSLLAGESSFGAAFCEKYDSPMRGKKVQYCIDQTAAAKNANGPIAVIYFMHGAMGGTEQYSWIGYEKSLAALNTRRALPPAWVVSFETSGTSFFTDWPGNDASKKYETWFLDEFMPYIEAKDPRLCHDRSCRAVFGVSMGGLGALKTALRHPDLFSIGAGTNPAILPFNAFEPYWKWDQYWWKTTAGLIFGRLFIWDLRKIFDTPDNFDEHFPPHLVDTFDASKPFPELYFDAAGHDEFGFQRGYNLMREHLDTHGYPYKARFFPKAHHVIPYAEQSASMVDYLMDELNFLGH